ncbi:hypothetical protein D9758_010492 [Tetrapyrgos nigripes]|uniref:FAD-binding domain-containing protein n=1 Tax=Tetrapyrgos nigripes TaxID=182062 RepID=A0A8H5CZM7_9AGAR|nr:hypothetical protein D9758_010492 [Tetrapyrgos nigripes]
MNTDSGPNTPRKLRLAILGAGIGGLSLATSIAAQWSASAGIEIDQLLSIDVYEAAPEITEIGAGITVWPRTWKVLKAIGLEQDLKAVLTERERRASSTEEQKLAFAFRKADQEDGFEFHRLSTPGGNTSFHRQDVQKTLMDHLPPFCKIHLSHRLSQWSETADEVNLTFENGATASYDMLIGADGINSVTRKCLAGQPYNGVFYTGTVAYRGLIPKEKLQEVSPGHRTIEEPTNYCGKSKHIIVYPISQGTIINVVAFCSRLEDEGKSLNGPAVRDSTTEELLEQYKGWEPEVEDLLKCVEKCNCWAIHDLKPLDTFISPQRRVALLGDAGHAMTPHLGAGAGQAIEDAYILGGILARLPLFLDSNTSALTKQNIDQLVPQMLQVYDTIRQPFANSIMSRARKQGRYYEFDAEEFIHPSETGQVMSTNDSSWIPLLQHKLTDQWSWAWTTPTAKDDLKRADEMLRVQCQELVA